PRSGRPPTSTTPDNIQRVRRMLTDDPSVIQNDSRRIEDKPRQCEQHLQKLKDKVYASPTLRRSSNV
ncbi:hypothetical protein AVEN_262442-1, partial [Araneus ventricosus]